MRMWMNASRAIKIRYGTFTEYWCENILCLHNIILLYYTQDNIYYIETETLEQYLIKGGSAAQRCPGVEPCLQAHKGFLIPDHVIQLHHSVLTSSWVITAFYFIFKKHYVYMYLRETRLLKRGPRSSVLHFNWGGNINHKVKVKVVKGQALLLRHF